MTGHRGICSVEASVFNFVFLVLQVSLHSCTDEWIPNHVVCSLDFD